MTIEPSNAYKAFDEPEWMFNYQSGFVRRGLFGEILYQIFMLHPYHVEQAILLLMIIFFIVFLCVTLKAFCVKKWYPIMPFAILQTSLYGYRRDFLMITIAYLMYYLIIKYIKENKNIYTLLFSTCGIVSVLLYEPSFFFIIPLCGLLYWYGEKKTQNTKTKRLEMTKLLLPTTICMAFVCLYKGNEESAKEIWASWAPLFDYENVNPELPSAIKFMNIPIDEVFRRHLGTNYGIGVGAKLGCNPLLILGTILMFIGFYYLLIKTPKENREDSVLLGSLYIYQIICLFPMFTVLSCDFGRTMHYVIYSCYFVVYLTTKYDIQFHVPMVEEWAICLNSIIDKHKLCSNYWFYIAVLAFVPYSIWCGVSILHPVSYEYVIVLLLPKIQLLLTYIGL